MSGETEGDVSGWTVDTLKAHMDMRLRMMQERLDERYEAQQVAMRAALEAAEKAVQSALAAAEKAVTKAESAAEKRFESVNEFRAQLSDQAGEFLSRPEYNAKHDALTDKIDALSKAIDQEQGKRLGSSQAVALLISLAVASVVVIGFFLGTR